MHVKIKLLRLMHYKTTVTVTRHRDNATTANFIKQYKTYTFLQSKSTNIKFKYNKLCLRRTLIITNSQLWRTIFNGLIFFPH